MTRSICLCTNFYVQTNLYLGGETSTSSRRGDLSVQTAALLMISVFAEETPARHPPAQVARTSLTSPGETLGTSWTSSGGCDSRGATDFLLREPLSSLKLSRFSATMSYYYNKATITCYHCIDDYTSSYKFKYKDNPPHAHTHTHTPHRSCYHLLNGFPMSPPAPGSAAPLPAGLLRSGSLSGEGPPVLPSRSAVSELFRFRITAAGKRSRGEAMRTCRR